MQATKCVDIEKGINDIIETELLLVLHKAINTLYHDTQDLDDDTRRRFINNTTKRLKETTYSFIEKQATVYNECLAVKS